MAPPANELDDDAVARLLAEDARAASARYASQGLSAMLPRRPVEGAAMRPNTRFLKNLVRDADVHNAALSRKEESERRARLRLLRDRHSVSAIDAHFDANYDPALDINNHPESAQQGQEEQEDWDLALEAFRDRQKWKQKQTDRMREAGFGDEEIKKWQESNSSGREKPAGSLRWAKAGEAREWDQGKQCV
ncbi:hypothetical protein DV738_g1292, partial [Chaetothyriales sp. CBS 135597]